MIEFTIKYIGEHNLIYVTDEDGWIVNTGDTIVVYADTRKKMWTQLKRNIDYSLTVIKSNLPKGEKYTWKTHWDIIITVISKRSEKLCFDQNLHSIGCKHRYLNLREKRYLCYYMPENPGKCIHIWYKLYHKGGEIALTPMFSSVLKVESYLEENDLNASDYEMKEVLKA